MDKLIVGILGLPVAILIAMFRYQIIQFTGKLDWAERNLGNGGSYTLILILAMIFWFGSLVYALGTFDQLFGFLDRFF